MWLGLLTIFLSSIIGGSINSVAVKLGVSQFPPLTYTVIRFFIATIVLFPIFLANTKQKLHKKDFLALFYISIFFTANMAIYSIALQFTTAIMAQLLYVFCPVVVMVFAHFFISERFSKEKIIGLLIALAGVAFLLYRSFNKETAHSFGTPLGNGLVLIGVLCFAAFLVMVRNFSKNYSGLTITFFNFLTTFVVLAFFMPIEWLFRPFILTDIKITGIESIGAIVFSSVTAFLLQQNSVRRTSAFVGSLSLYISPFFTALTAILILGEKITLPFILGGVLVGIGVFYATAYHHIKQLFTSKEVLVEN